MHPRRGPLTRSPTDPCPGSTLTEWHAPSLGTLVRVPIRHLSGSTLTEWVCKPAPHKPTHPELGWGSVCHQDILPGRDRLRGEWDLALVISHPPQKREDGEYGKSTSWGRSGGGGGGGNATLFTLDTLLQHTCQPSLFRWDSPTFTTLVPLSHFYPLLSHFLKSTSVDYKVAKKMWENIILNQL